MELSPWYALPENVPSYDNLLQIIDACRHAGSRVLGFTDILYIVLQIIKPSL